MQEKCTAILTYIVLTVEMATTVYRTPIGR